MSKLVIASFMLLAGIIPTVCASAEESPARLIREDRIWEYHSTWGFWQGATYRMKFDGTVEKEGKTWHNLRVIDAREFDYRALALDEKGLPEIRFTEFPNKEEFLLREEGNKVYIYIKNLTDHHPDAESLPSEMVLYDFDLTLGDSYTPFTNYLDRPVKDPEELRVKELNYVTDHLGNKLRHQVFECVEHGVFDVEVVESVGNISYGSLASMETTMATGFGGELEGDYPNLFHGDQLIRVTDLEGNVIYGDVDYEYPTYHKLTDNSYTWVYSSDEKDMVTECIYQFSGKETVNGHTYSRLNQVDEKVYDKDADGKLTLKSSDNTSRTVALLREMGNVVYVAFPKQSDYTKEYRLYDFNVSQGDSYTIMPGYQQKERTETVKDVKDVTVDKKGLKLFYTEFERPATIGPSAMTPRAYVEAIGNCGAGLLHDVTSDEALKFSFSRLMNGQETILTAADINALLPVGVETVADESSAITLTATSDGFEAVAAGRKLTVEIYSLDGTGVATASGTGRVSVSTDALLPGAYIVKATDGSSAKTLKAIVK